MTPASQLIHRLIGRFPRAGNQTIARMAYAEEPKHFSSVEGARSAVRLARGASGPRNRRTIIDKSAYRPPAKPGNPFGKMPPALTHFKNWRAVEIPGPMKAAILADAHIPYHDPEALRLALRYAHAQGCDTVVLNGDTADFFTVSFWEKDPTQRDFPHEVASVKAFLEVVRGLFPKARIILKCGNHEERFERYMRVKAPELFGVEDFSVKALLKCDQYGIEVVGDKRPLRLGHLNIIHGHEFGPVMTNPVNPARGFFLRAKTHMLGSHYHQTSQHSEKNLEQNVVSTWSTGCLCNLHPDYKPLNAWNHGFAIVEIDKRNAFQVHNLRIVKGRIW